MLLLGTAVMPIASAQQTHYTDVPTGAYYESAASALIDIGALDSSETRLRPADLATRAELVKLLVSLKSQQLLYPSVSSFNDVSVSAWYSPYFEAAANAGWVHGDGNCYQKSRPCTARPPAQVNRAEAAALLMRAFALEHTGTAPQFVDNAQSQWYYMPIQTAADHCVLQGDAPTGRVRPAASMNRAEMIVMFHRAYMNMEYGSDCGTLSPDLSTVTPLSATRLRLTFSADLNTSRAQDESRYDIVRVSNNTSIAVNAAILVNARTVDLDLGSSLMEDSAYTMTASNLSTTGGVFFSDSQRFTFTGPNATGHLTGASTVSASRVRVTFDTDIDATAAQDESRYVLARLGGAGNIAIDTATRIGVRTVDLDLRTNLAADSSYLLSVPNMRTDAGVTFGDSITFTYATETGEMSGATAISSTHVRVIFDTTLDRNRAEDESRYTVERISVGGTVDIRNATLVDSRTVDLELASALVIGGSYRVSGASLLTSGGVTFSDTITFVFAASSSARISTVTAPTSTTIRIVFDSDVDSIRAEQTSHYSISDGSRSIQIRTANLNSDKRTVDLDLIEAMTTQHSYTVSVLSMLTTSGASFSDTKTVVFDSGVSVNLRTTITGTQELPIVITTARGSGSFLLTANGLHYDIAVTGMSGAITGAHFHQGTPSESGPVVMPITFTNNRSVGDWTGLTDALRNAILNGDIYVNVHTAAHPSGEIRGQLLKQ